MFFISAREALITNINRFKSQEDTALVLIGSPRASSKLSSLNFFLCNCEDNGKSNSQMMKDMKRLQKYKC